MRGDPRIDCNRLAVAMVRRVEALLPPTPPALPATPAVPLPEAPASVNVHLTIAGRQVQLTLRDHDEARLLVRLEEVLQRFPLGGTPPDTQTRPAGWCATHEVQMKLNHKDGRSWWAHPAAGGWCKGTR